MGKILSNHKGISYAQGVCEISSDYDWGEQKLNVPGSNMLNLLKILLKNDKINKWTDLNKYKDITYTIIQNERNLNDEDEVDSEQSDPIYDYNYDYRFDIIKFDTVFTYIFNSQHYQISREYVKDINEYTKYYEYNSKEKVLNILFKIYNNKLPEGIDMYHLNKYEENGRLLYHRFPIYNNNISYLNLIDNIKLLKSIMINYLLILGFCDQLNIFNNKGEQKNC